jgi:hypothetical protein
MTTGTNMSTFHVIKKDIKIAEMIAEMIVEMNVETIIVAMIMVIKDMKTKDTVTASKFIV